MIDDLDRSVTDAFRVAEAAGIFPTSMSAEEIRNLPADVRARAFFTARGTSAVFAQAIKDVAEAGAAGEIGEAEMRARLLGVLNSLGYTPERGFPDSPVGAVPPAERGSLQDLSSFRRLDLIVRTTLDLVRGAGQQMRGHTRLETFPCWELVRIQEAEHPRNWRGRFEFVKRGLLDPDDDQPIFFGGRMIAPKGDPLWGELGSSENFDDALDVDYAPFAYNSGMWLQEVSAYDAKRYGVVASNGQSIADFHADQPITILGQLPKPKMSMRGVDRTFLEKVKAETLAEEIDFDLEFDQLLADELRKADIAYGKENPRGDI